MSSHRNHHPDAGRTQRDAVEQILNEVSGATPAEADALLALFSAAGGPVRPGELAGETAAVAAVAAFRAAHHQPLTARRDSPMKRSLAALLTVKTAAAALVLTSMGGVALAATGVVPTPLTESKAEKVQDQADRAAAKQAKDAAKDAAGAVKDAAKAAAAADRAAAKAGRDHTVSFDGLCTAYAAGNKTTNGKALHATAFTRLIDAAGTAGVPVPAFCEALALETPAAPAAEGTAIATATEGAKGKSAAAREKAEAKAAAKGRSAAAHDEAKADNGRAGEERSRAGLDNGRSADADNEGKAGKANGRSLDPHGNAAVDNS